MVERNFGLTNPNNNQKKKPDTKPDYNAKLKNEPVS